MKVIITSSQAAELKLDAYHEVVRCCFFIGMNFHETLQVVRDNTPYGVQRRAHVIEDAQFLGINNNDKVLVDG